MSKRVVKVAVHDYPKRSDMSRHNVVVEAADDHDAIVEAMLAARVLWPGGKARAFDVRPARDDEPLTVPKTEQKRTTLKAKVA